MSEVEEFIKIRNLLMTERKKYGEDHIDKYFKFIDEFYPEWRNPEEISYEKELEMYKNYLKHND